MVKRNLQRIEELEKENTELRKALLENLKSKYELAKILEKVLAYEVKKARRKFITAFDNIQNYSNKYDDNYKKLLGVMK